MNNTGDIYCVMPICEKIYNISDNSIINLSNLTNTNNKYIELIKKNGLNANKIMDEQDNKYFLPNYISGIYIKNNSNFLVWVISYHMVENKFQTDKFNHHILQEYSKDGNLIKYYIIEHKNENGLVSFIKYLNNSNEILVCRKISQKGWTLVFYKES